MLTVEIGPECSPAGTGTTADLRLILLQLTTTQAYDGVYCYASINGSRYERLPAEPGLLLATSGDLAYDLPLQLSSRGQYRLTAPSSGLITLDGECWGRRGAESQRIGHFSGSHASPEWDGRDLTAELALAERETASLHPLAPSAGGAVFVRYRIQPFSSRPDLSRIAPGALDAIYLNLPPILDSLEGTDTVIPAPTNLRVRNVAGCESFPTSDPDIGISVCDGALAPILEWGWTGNSFYTEADITGWRVNVSFTQDELRPDALPQSGPVIQLGRASAAAAGRRSPMPVIPSYYACGVTAQVTVTAITSRGNSLPSQPLEIAQPSCPFLGTVRITVNSLTLGPSARTGEVHDDGDICILCADRRLEVFGDIFIGVHNAAPSFRGMPRQDAGTILLGNCPHGTACLTEGNYQWRVGPHIAPWLSEMEVSAQSLGSQGEITFVAVLQDYDTQNGIDNYCIASASLAPRNKSEWTRVNERVLLTGGSSEASCQVEILVQGIPDFSAP